MLDRRLADARPSSRGKVMFLMDNGDPYRTRYLAGPPEPARAACCSRTPNPGQPDAAFVERNDADRRRGRRSADLVQRGLRGAHPGRRRHGRGPHRDDTARRDAALASGAQWVSTDYPVPDYGVGFATPYFVEIPGGTVARCNPVNAPEGAARREVSTSARGPRVGP